MRCFALASRDRKSYGKKLKEAAEKLGKSKRTVQRLVKKWEEEGLAALTQTKCADRGSHRINDELEKFIITLRYKRPQQWVDILIPILGDR